MRNLYAMLVRIDGGYSERSVMSALDEAMREISSLESMVESLRSIGSERPTQLYPPLPPSPDGGPFVQKFSSVEAMERMGVHGIAAWVEGYGEPFDWIGGKWVRRGVVSLVGGGPDSEKDRAVRADELVHRDDGVADVVESGSVADGGQAVEGQSGAEDEAGRGD